MQSQENLLAHVNEATAAAASQKSINAHSDEEKETPQMKPMPAPGVYDTVVTGHRQAVDSLKCHTPLFSGHAIVDSPLKGWSWYANAPPADQSSSSEPPN